MIVLLFDAPVDFEQRVHGLLPNEEVVRTAPGEPGYREAIREATIIAGRPNLEDLRRAVNLSWLQLSSAGADRFVGAVAGDILLTNASGVYGVPTSEHAVALMLAMVRRVPQSVRAAGENRWERNGRYDELYGRTCGILGLGDIGSAIARRAKAFGMRVLALRRTPGHPREDIDAVYGGTDGLHDLLPECDHVVNVLPGTPETRHMIDSAALARMKASAYFYNVGRGSTVDEAALVHALEAGTLAGAGLDVFEDEPLPPESPLWTMENVLITPHRGGASPREEERVAELFLENLKRWRDGAELRNVVDPDLGY